MNIMKALTYFSPLLRFIPKQVIRFVGQKFAFTTVEINLQKTVDILP